MFTLLFFFFQAEDGIRDGTVTGVQTCALPISDGVAAKGDRLVCRMPNSGQSAARRRRCAFTICCDFITRSERAEASPRTPSARCTPERALLRKDADTSAEVRASGITTSASARVPGPSFVKIKVG